MACADEGGESERVWARYVCIGGAFDTAPTYGAVQSHTTAGSRQSIDLTKVWKRSDESLDGQKPSMWWNMHESIICDGASGGGVCCIESYFDSGGYSDCE